MGRKNKTKINNKGPSTSADESGNFHVEEIDENKPAILVEGVTMKQSLISMLEKAKYEDKIDQMKIKLVRKDDELDCAKRVIDVLKKDNTETRNIEISKSKQIIAEMMEKTRQLEEEKAEAVAQIGLLKKKLLEKDFITRNSSTELSKVNDEISDEFQKTRKEIEKAQNEIIDLEKKLDITSGLLEESKRSSETEKFQLMRMLQDHNEATQNELACYKQSHADLTNELNMMKTSSLKLESALISKETEKDELLLKYKSSLESSKKLEKEMADMKLQLEESSRLASEAAHSKNALDDSIAVNNTLRQRFEAQFIQLDANVKQFKEDFDILKVELSTSRRNCEKLTAEAESAKSLTSERDALLVRIKTFEATSEETKELSKKVAELTKQLETTQNEKKKCDVALKNADKRFTTKSKSTNKEIATLKENIKRLTAELETGKKALEDAQNSTSYLEISSKKLNDDIDAFKKAAADSDEKLRSAQEEKKQLEARLLEADSKIKSENQNVVKLQSRVEELQRSAENQQKRLEQELLTAKTLLHESQEALAFERNENETNLKNESNTLKLVEASLDEAIRKCGLSEKVREELQQKVQGLEKTVKLLEQEKTESEKFSQSELESLKTKLETATEDAKSYEESEKRISELQSSYDSLKTQSETEKKHLEEEISILREKIGRSEKIANELQIECKKLIAELEQSSSKAVVEERQKLNEKIDVLKAKLEESEKVANDREVECRRLVSMVSKTEEAAQRSAAGLENQGKELVAMKEALEKQRNSLNKEFDQLKVQLEQSRLMLEEEKEANKKMMDASAKKEEQLKKSAEEKEKELASSIKAAEAEKKKVLDQMVREKTAVEQKNGELEATVNKMQSDLSAARKQLEEKEQAFEHETSKISGLQEQIQNAEKLSTERTAECDKLRSELEKLKKIADRNTQLESRIEELQRSASNRQKRLEEELDQKNQKLQQAESQQEKLTQQLETRLHQLETSSEEEKRRLVQDLQVASERIVSLEEEQKNSMKTIEQFELRFLEVEAKSLSEREELDKEIAEYKAKIGDLDAVIAANNGDFEKLQSMIALMEKEAAAEIEVRAQHANIEKQSTTTVLEIDSKNQEAVVNVNEINDIEAEEWDENLPFTFDNIEVWQRQISRRLGLLRHNPSFAIYPYVRYIFVAYLILVHLYLFW